MAEPFPAAGAHSSPGQESFLRGLQLRAGFWGFPYPCPFLLREVWGEPSFALSPPPSPQASSSPGRGFPGPLFLPAPLSLSFAALYPPALLCCLAHKPGICCIGIKSCELLHLLHMDRSKRSVAICLNMCTGSINADQLQEIT